MGKFIKTTLLILIVLIGGFVLYHRNDIRSVNDLLQIARSKVSAINIGYTSRIEVPGAWAQPKPLDRLRMATFKLNPYLNLEFNPLAAKRLGSICRQFDLIAFQQFSPQNPSAVAEFLVQLNRGNANFRYIAEPSGGGLAFIYDANTVELVDSRFYSVNDPDNLFAHNPFVAWFRTKRASPQQAYTFTVANIQTSQERPDVELGYLGELFRAIRADGRGEDDVLIVGDFNSGIENLQPLDQRQGLTWVVNNTPTNTLQTGQFDNIVFNPTATVEFSGNSGVFDFLKLFNLSLNDALQVSDRMPVWAEFALNEGQQIRTFSPSVPTNQSFPVPDPTAPAPNQWPRAPVDLQANSNEHHESTVQHFQPPAPRFRQVGTGQ